MNTAGQGELRESSCQLLVVGRQKKQIPRTQKARPRDTWERLFGAEIRMEIGMSLRRREIEFLTLQIAIV